MNENDDSPVDGMGYPMFRQTHFWFKDVLMFQNRGFYRKRLGKTRIQCDLTHKHDILAMKCGLYQPHLVYSRWFNLIPQNDPWPSEVPLNTSHDTAVPVISGHI
jgi:hypothetical protein